jgi:hypothetical protein
MRRLFSFFPWEKRTEVPLKSSTGERPGSGYSKKGPVVYFVTCSTTILSPFVALALTNGIKHQQNREEGRRQFERMFTT